MRKVTREIVGAFLDGQSRTIGNSMTNGEALFLHGNMIAWKGFEGLYIDTCGWKSNTTKERLNAIPNVSIFQKAGVWYLNGKVWDGKPTLIDGNRHN